MQHFDTHRRNPLDRTFEKGQIIIEGLLLMIFLASTILILIRFSHKQEEVLKKYELPAKIKTR